MHEKCCLHTNCGTGSPNINKIDNLKLELEFRIGDEITMPITIMRKLAYNRSYPKIGLGPVSTLCPVPGYDVGRYRI